MKITEYIEKENPVDIARTLGTRQDTSTRDKKRLFKKAKFVQDYFEKIGKPLDVK
jgi:hypothetical protein